MKNKRRQLFWIFFLFSVAVILVSCTPNPATLPINDSRIITSGSAFGQSFTAQYDGLSGISILLGPLGSDPSGSLLFHLRSNPESDEDLARARLPIAEVTGKDYYRFDFPPQIDSRGKDYFLDVEVEDGRNIEIYTAEADSYLDGALYIDQIPQDAQLGFRLEYDQKNYLFGFSHFGVQWIIVLLTGLFAFVVPGWAIFSLVWRGWGELVWPSKLGLSCGISLCIYPLLFLWTDLVNLHLGAFYAWFPPIIGILILAWKNRKSLQHIRFPLHNRVQIQWEYFKIHPDIILADLAFMVILGLIILSRFWVIRSLEIPLYGDSYQHTMMTQLMIDNRGLFDSWEPYADLATFTYHFGFHSSAAVYHWISGLSAEKAILWTGQLLNIFAIISLYPLAYKITRNRWTGVLAMLIAGLLSPMPMAYVNWGRYTQLAGQVILSAAIWSAWSLLERPFPNNQKKNWIHQIMSWQSLDINLGNISVIWIAVGGIALTHYRILILYILFFPAYLLITFARKTFLSTAGRVIWMGIGGIILSLPWFIHIFGGRLVRGLAIQMTTIPPKTPSSAELFSGIGNLQDYFPIILWIIFILCLGWSLWRQRKDIVVISLWWFLIVLATNPAWIGLPGSGVISNFTVFIAFYIPASLVISSTIFWTPTSRLHEIDSHEHPKIDIKNQIWFPVVILVVICGLGLWGVRKRISDLNLSRYELVTQSDLRALEWIQDNTNKDATFLVNSFFAYNDSLAVGSDAGWWIPLLARRATTLPPLTYGIEDGMQNNAFNEINEFNREILSKGITDPDVISSLRKSGVKYIYIGQRQGSVNNNAPKVLDPQLLRQDPNFKVLYNQDRVWIFELLGND